MFFKLTNKIFTWLKDECKDDQVWKATQIKGQSRYKKQQVMMLTQYKQSLDNRNKNKSRESDQVFWKG